MRELGQIRISVLYVGKKNNNQADNQKLLFCAKENLVYCSLTKIKFMWFSLWSYLIWGWTIFYNQIVGILRVSAQSF